MMATEFHGDEHLDITAAFSAPAWPSSGVHQAEHPAAWQDIRRRYRRALWRVERV